MSNKAESITRMAYACDASKEKKHDVVDKLLTCVSKIALHLAHIIQEMQH
jgi:hypothetical protein